MRKLEPQIFAGDTASVKNRGHGKGGSRTQCGSDPCPPRESAANLAADRNSQVGKSLGV